MLGSAEERHLAAGHDVVSPLADEHPPRIGGGGSVSHIQHLAMAQDAAGLRRHQHARLRLLMLLISRCAGGDLSPHSNGGCHAAADESAVFRRVVALYAAGQEPQTATHLPLRSCAEDFARRGKPHA